MAPYVSGRSQGDMEAGSASVADIGDGVGLGAGCAHMSEPGVGVAGVSGLGAGTSHTSASESRVFVPWWYS